MRRLEDVKLLQRGDDLEPPAEREHALAEAVKELRRIELEPRFRDGVDQVVLVDGVIDYTPPPAGVYTGSAICANV
jgi:hypothetical protein